MPGKPRKKKRKRTRYTKVTIKLTARQKKSLFNYCNARQTTPNKLIKKSIRRFINGFDKEIPDEYFVTENQLDLFEEPDELPEDAQVKIEEAETTPEPLEVKDPEPETGNLPKTKFTKRAGGKKGIPSFDLFSNDYADM
jgi:hypothetical protein